MKPKEASNKQNKNEQVMKVCKPIPLFEITINILFDYLKIYFQQKDLLAYMWLNV